MKKLMRLFITGVCVAVLAAGTPVWGSSNNVSPSNITNNTNSIIVVIPPNLKSSIDNLSIDSTEEEIDNIKQMLEEWDTEEYDSGGLEGMDTNSLIGTMTSVSSMELGPAQSLQLMFAKLQLEQSGITKDQATNFMNEISVLQQKQKAVAELFADLNAINSSLGDETTLVLPSKLKEQLVSLEICPNNYSALMKSEVNKEDVQNLIYMATAKLDQLGVQTQQMMVYLQDFMGQYNSYLDSANTQISNANQTLTSLAKGMTVSGEGSSMLFTSIFGGAGAGVIGTLLVQFVIKKRKKS